MTCPSCGTDTRACKNCRFYSPGSWHDCAERSDELVKDKERANFCDQFQLNPAFRSDHPVKGTQPGAETPGRSAFDDLFKS